jgi:hypothetical protein
VSIFGLKNKNDCFLDQNYRPIFKIFLFHAHPSHFLGVANDHSVGRGAISLQGVGMKIGHDNV